MAFFQGTLQEGIASALTQLKSVVCFVTDDQDESQLWENEFLKEEDVKQILNSNSVLLRLEAGSTEEGFLAQLYPLPKKPTIVVIKDGALKEYIAAGVTQESFKERLFKSLGAPLPQHQPPHSQTENLAETETAQATASPPQAALLSVPSSVSPPIQQTLEENSSANTSDPASAPAPASPPAPAPRQFFNSDVQARAVAAAQRAQRATELAKQRKEEENAKRRREEKGKAKEEPPSKDQDAPHKHAEALRKKQQEAREERQRILLAIEADKAERKARLAAAQAERRAAAEAEAQFAESPAPSTPLPVKKTGRSSEHAAIQVRLFDGSTIRHRFSSSNTLKDVRQWVDENREDGKDAYTFKILLTPLPSKTVDTTEEDKTLRDLELTPSATLILVHIPRSVSAFSSSGGSASWAAPAAQAEGNIFQRIIGFLLAIITGIFGGIATFFSTLFSTSGPPSGSERDGSQTPEAHAQPERPVQQIDRRIGGLDSIRRRNEQQFYNGNSTNFESRPDDEE